MSVFADTQTTRARILDAALVEFNGHGVAGATIEDIRQRSGASVGSIYHHFGGKVELAGTLYIETLAAYHDGFLATLAQAEGAREGVQAVVHYHLGWITENDESARFLFVGGEERFTRRGELPLSAVNRRFFRQVRAWMKPYVERGELRSLEPELLSALWIGPSQDLARHWLAGRVKKNPIGAASELADAAWRCLCP